MWLPDRVAQQRIDFGEEVVYQPSFDDEAVEIKKREEEEKRIVVEAIRERYKNDPLGDFRFVCFEDDDELVELVSPRPGYYYRVRNNGVKLDEIAENEYRRIGIDIRPEDVYQKLRQRFKDEERSGLILGRRTR